MKRLFITVLLVIVSLVAFNSCSKKAADMIVGHWKIASWYDGNYWDVFQSNAIWEFDSDGTLRFEAYGKVYQGTYSVVGSDVRLSYVMTIGNDQVDQFVDGKIINMGETWMEWSANYCAVDFYRTEESVPDLPGGVDIFYQISATASPFEGGSVSGAGSYKENDACTLVAVANPGYVFTNWTEDNNVISADEHYFFAVTGDRNLVANFELAYNPSQNLQFEWNGYVYRDGETIICGNDIGFGELVQYMQIRNATDEEGSIVIEKEVVQDLDGVSNFFCWGMCYGPNVISSLPVSVPAQSLNSEDLSFHALYEDQVYGVVVVRYYAYEENHPDERISITVRYNRFSGVITEGATISVTGDTWYVLDHQYSDGETIHLENATFGLYGAADDGGHQQLVSGGEEGIGDRLRIGQCGLYSTDYNYLYFNMGSSESLLFYGYVTSLDDGSILNDADVVFSPSSIWINGKLITSYDIRHLNLSTNMCLFANGKDGWDVVQDQTATLGTVTITDAYGNVTAKYIPTIDGNGTPYFYNSVSGAAIYHSGSGTPIFSR